MMIHLYELDAYHKASGHVHRWYLCAGSAAWQSWSGDSPANVTWLPLVGQWAEVIVQAAGDGGQAPKRDDLELINVRRSDDLPRFASVRDLTAGTWLRVALGERPLNLLLTDYAIQRVVEKEVDERAPYASAVTLWIARAGMPSPERTSIKLPLSDRQADFDTPVQVARYAGTGTFEGPAELKDTLKEIPIGHVPMAAPQYLGYWDGYHHWSVGGGQPVEDVPRGWSLGVAVNKTSGTPGSNQFTADLSTGYLTTAIKYEDFRVEVKGRKFAGAWKRYIGETIAALATGAGIVTATAVAGIDATPRTIGLYLPPGDGRTHKEVYDRLVGSVARGRWFMDAADTLVVTRLRRPSTALPTRSYRLSDGSTTGLVPLTRTSSTPAKQVVLRFAENPNPVTQTARDALAADTALWTQRWREATSTENAAIAAAYGPAAKPATVETALTLASDAAAELAAWVAEKEDPPQAYELKVRDGAPGVWIGGAVSVTDNVAGFEAGGTVVVYGRTNRDRGGGATLYVED